MRVVNEFIQGARFFSVCVLAFYISVSGAAAETYSATGVPWSGHWWPTGAGELVLGYRGGDDLSPIEKYDLAVSGVTSGPAYQYGIQHYLVADSETWAGFCFEWAASAIQEPEPDKPGIYNGVLFNVGDKKGLLTISYDGAVYTRYNTYQADIFHWLLESEIREKGNPVVINLSDNEAVWCYPVFKYRTSYVTSGERRHYTTTVYFADDGVRPDYVGSAIYEKIYAYYLDVDETGAVVRSGWENPADTSPPRAGYIVTGTIPNNPGLDLDTVRAIAAASDDGFESNQTLDSAARLNAGEHLLLLLDDDYYRIPFHADERISLKFTAEDSQMRMALLDQRGSRVDVLAPGESYYLETDDSGILYLEVLATHYINTPLYEIDLTHEMAAHAVSLGAQRDRVDCSLQLYNPYANAMNVRVSVMRDRGGCIASEPLRLMPGAKSVDMNALNLDRYMDATTYVRVDAERPVSGYQFLSDGGACTYGTELISDEAASAVLYFPHYARGNGWTSEFSVIRSAADAGQVIVECFDETGGRLHIRQVEVPANGMYRFDVYDLGMTHSVISRMRTLQVRDAEGEAVLTGCMRFELSMNGFALNGSAAIPALRAEDAAEQLTAAHIAENSAWRTGLAVMNVSDQTIAVTGNAYDARGVLLDTRVWQLAAKGNLVAVASRLFTDAPPESLAWATFTSDSGASLCGFLKFIDSNDANLGGVRLSAMSDVLPETAGLTLIPGGHVRYWGGIFVNPSDDVTGELEIQAWSADAGLLAERNFSIPSGWQQVVTVEESMGISLDTVDYLTVKNSEQTGLTGFFLTGNGQGMMGACFP
ncbi:MAG: hypothetical protein CSA22_03995 [Deltaproteobacteria bacterium]|nr:MAG: hypothetical protein CSA22_03995 [Deltaproteobacteria bacterium]